MRRYAVMVAAIAVLVVLLLWFSPLLSDVCYPHGVPLDVPGATPIIGPTSC